MDEAEALKLIIDITAQIAARAKMPVDIVVPLSAHEKFIFNSVNTQLGLPEDELSSFIVNTTDVYKRDGVQDWNDLAPDFVAVLIRLHAPSNLQKTTVTIRVMQEKSAMPQLPLDIALAGVR